MKIDFQAILLFQLIDSAQHPTEGPFLRIDPTYGELQSLKPSRSENDSTYAV
jgi:hypothetical protein